MKKLVVLALVTCVVLSLTAGVAHAGRGWYGTVTATVNGDGSIRLQWPAAPRADVYSAVVSDMTPAIVRIYIPSIPGSSTEYTIDAATAQQYLSVGTNYQVMVGAGRVNARGDVHWARNLISWGTLTY